MIQYIVIAIIFLISVVYVVRLMSKGFFAKNSGCSKGCGCSMEQPVTERLKKVTK